MRDHGDITEHTLIEHEYTKKTEVALVRKTWTTYPFPCPQKAAVSAHGASNSPFVCHSTRCVAY